MSDQLWEWQDAVENSKNLIFRIFTTKGSGTGFLVSRSDTRNLIAVATALHVIDHAHAWEEPIRVQHYTTGKTFFLKSADRAIYFNQELDTAAIIFELNDLTITDPIPELIGENKVIKIGVEVAWLGFPAVSSGELCFFSGRVSSQIQGQTAYLIDGVAINGVSGGPTLWLGYNEIQYIGVVSAYIPNRSTGEALPGLSVVQSVTQFHDVVRHIRSIDEARAREEVLSPEQISPDIQSNEEEQS